MLITRSPLRISLGGGGTDLPSYARAHGGFVLAAAIDKYVYVTVTRPFTPGIFLKYSKHEHAADVDHVEHPIMREALKLVGVTRPQHEISTLADIPAGTGLGSSGSFTTALLRALFLHERKLLLPGDVARLACEIEIGQLGRAVGKQDPYIAAYGGLTCLHFHPDDRVTAEPLAVSAETLSRLEDDLVLYFVGFTRDASAVLRDQDERTRRGDGAMLTDLHETRALGLHIKAALERGEPAAFGEMMNAHWARKRLRAGVSNARIDEWYDLARKNGALGGKLVGAGGGGFLLFYAEDRSALRVAMGKAGLTEVRLRFDFEGTKVLLA
jgi:D-glycero-alpha-D-manno-heptose-7-phosphate kinase